LLSKKLNNFDFLSEQQADHHEAQDMLQLRQKTAQFGGDKTNIHHFKQHLSPFSYLGNESTAKTYAKEFCGT
jgi:hypothetical protein